MMIAPREFAHPTMPQTFFLILPATLKGDAFKAHFVASVTKLNDKTE